MPEAFVISPGETYERERYQVGSYSALHLMHVECPSCGTRAMNGHYYVAVDPEMIDPEAAACFRAYHPEARGMARFTGPTTISVAQLDMLRERLAPVLGPDLPVVPGMALGPALSSAAGRFGDFAWAGPKTRMFLRRSTLEVVRAAGFDLAAVVPGLWYRRDRIDPLVEPDIPLSAHLAGWRDMETCDICGLLKRPPGLGVVDAASWDDRIPMQRVRERADVILVNQALATFIREREMTDVRLSPATFS